MNSTEPGCGGRTALAPLVVLVVLLAIGPAVAGASGGGHPAVAGASSDGDVAGEAITTASDVDGPVPAATGDASTAADAGSAADGDTPFLRAYGEAEPDLPTSVVVHSVAEGEGPIVEAGGELDMAAGDASLALGEPDHDVDGPAPGSIREATLDADPARDLETDPAAVEGSVRRADVTGDPSTGSGDQHSAPGVWALVEGMTVPLDPLGGDLAGFALGSLFGGFVVAAFALRRRGGVSTPGTDGPTGPPGSDDPAQSPAPDGPDESPVPDDPTNSPALDGPTGSPAPDDPTESPTLDGPDESPDPDGPDGSDGPEPPRGTDATTADDAPSAATATPPDSGDDDPDAGPPPLEVEPGLVPDDCLVERLLARHDGRLKQSAIVDRTGWSKSKVSRLLTRMADDGRVVKVQVGRENVIYLDGAEPRVVSDSSPED